MLLLCLLLLMVLNRVSAQLQNSSIGTCPNVNNCGSVASLPQCLISANYNPQTFEYIGINSFSVPIAPSNWSWTVGYGDATKLDKFYYLGTNKGYDKSTGPLGWAIFFTNVKAELNGGTCASALPGSCVGDLEIQASGVLTGMRNVTGDAIRTFLEQTFNNSTPDSCSSVFDRNDTGVHVQQITGSGAPTYENIPDQGFSSCYPTLPMSNDLSFIFTFNQTGLPISENLERVVGVMTVLDTQPQRFAHLECMAAYQSINTAQQPHSKSAASANHVGLWSGVMALIVAGGLTML